MASIFQLSLLRINKAQKKHLDLIFVKSALLLGAAGAVAGLAVGIVTGEALGESAGKGAAIGGAVGALVEEWIVIKMQKERLMTIYMKNL
tara:strand:- start:121 stop:390 length:270 start_codon:yes stop_codon:yes gene_type:complete